VYPVPGYQTYHLQLDQSRKTETGKGQVKGVFPIPRRSKTHEHGIPGYDSLTFFFTSPPGFARAYLKLLNLILMAEFKRQTFQLSSGKQIKLHGNSFFINRSLEIGEGFVPNIFSLFEEQSEGKPATTVSNPHNLTLEELHELADYNIRLWLDLKDSLRSNGISNPKVFSRETIRGADNSASDSTPKYKREKPNSTKEI
jgi:hypothetical protein